MCEFCDNIAIELDADIDKVRQIVTRYIEYLEENDTYLLHITPEAKDLFEEEIP